MRLIWLTHKTFKELFKTDSHLLELYFGINRVHIKYKGGEFECPYTRMMFNGKDLFFRFLHPQHGILLFQNGIIYKDKEFYNRKRDVVEEEHLHQMKENLSTIPV